MAKKKICEFCKKETKNELTDNLCKNCFKKFCSKRKEYKKENLEAELAKVYIVLLQKNKQLSSFYLKNKIKGGNFLEIRKKSDFKKISDGEMIYFLSSKNITNEYKEEIKKSGSNWSIKLAVSEKKFKNLNNACSTHIKSCKDFKKTHRIIKEIIECITLPSLVGLDYADIRQLFMMNSRIEIKKYKTKLDEKDKIIKEIKKKLKN